MNKAQQKRFDSLYRKHINALRRQGKADTTIDAYSRAVRRVCEFFDSPPIPCPRNSSKPTSIRW